MVDAGSMGGPAGWHLNGSYSAANPKCVCCCCLKRVRVAPSTPLQLAGHRLSLCDLKISSGQACSLRLAGVRDPEQLHSLLQPGPVLPTGAQLTSLALRRCRISAAAFHSCALLAWIKSLDLEGCSSPGGIDAGLHALLQNCGQQLRLLFCVTGRADARLVAFPEQLAACGRLQCLALLCHGAPWDWPTGPYLTGALLDAGMEAVDPVRQAGALGACAGHISPTPPGMPELLHSPQHPFTHAPLSARRPPGSSHQHAAARACSAGSSHQPRLPQLVPPPQRR